MRLQALIFDVDGTLADTERHGHLPASNAAMAQLGYDIVWTWDEFAALYEIPGNHLRFRYALKQRGVPEAEIVRATELFKPLKQRLYIEQFLPNLPLRPGVRQMIDAALRAGVRLAIVSTTHEAQIHALLDHQLADVRDHFQPVLGKESGIKTAPGSPLHRLCLAQLGLPAARVLMIEDSAVGLAAALRADVPTAVIYNNDTFGQDFTGARLVACSLAPFTLAQLDALCLGVPDDRPADRST